MIQQLIDTPSNGRVPIQSVSRHAYLLKDRDVENKRPAQDGLLLWRWR